MFLLSGSAVALACLINVYMFTQRGRMGEVKTEQDQVEAIEVEEKGEDILTK